MYYIMENELKNLMQKRKRIIDKKPKYFSKKSGQS